MFGRPETQYNETEEEIARLEPAWAKAALYFRSGMRYGHRGSYKARSMLEVWQELEVRRRRFEAGSTMELLHAVLLCGEENLPMPSWLAIAYGDLFTAFLQPGGAPSLDAVFFSKNLPTDTPKKAAETRLDWQLGSEIWRAVWDVADSHQSLNSALKAVLATKNYGVKITKARELVDRADHTQSELLGHREPQLKRHFELKRKK
jgi:hypothetical protein